MIDWDKEQNNSLIEHYECCHIIINQSWEREILYISKTARESSEDWSLNVMIFEIQIVEW